MASLIQTEEEGWITDFDCKCFTVKYHSPEFLEPLMWPLHVFGHGVIVSFPKIFEILKAL